MKKSFKRLVIDTASDYLYLALLVDDEEKGNVYEYGHQNHSVTILPSLEKLLQNQGLELQDVDEIILGIGPGSYTGVRIGVSIAKMIAYLNETPVKTVSSLALLASSSNADNIVPMIDARRGNSFIAFYKLIKGTLVQVFEDQLVNTESFLSQVEQPFVKVSEGKPDLSKILGSSLLNSVENIHDLVPNYLQITEAERNLKQC